WIFVAGIFGFSGVALGAFGAHIISDILTENLYDTYKTGVLYHLIHSVVILAIGLSQIRNLNTCSLFFSIGIILFSVSLYLYAFTEKTVVDIFTPFRGISFLTGWALLVWKALSKK